MVDWYDYKVQRFVEDIISGLINTVALPIYIYVINIKINIIQKFQITIYEA